MKPSSQSKRTPPYISPSLILLLPLLILFLLPIMLSFLSKSLLQRSTPSVTYTATTVLQPSALSIYSHPITFSRLYHERVVNHYENPRNVGSLDKNNKNVGTGLVGAPACGDVMKFQIEVDNEGKVTKAVFKTFGCGSAIASSSVATEWVKGKSVDDCLKIQNTDIASHLNLPPVKLHCSMLAEDAIKAAITDYKSKNNKTN